MSTRATYKFEPAPGNRRHRPTVTIYVHYDGYESGAAVYFYAMLTHKSKGGSAEAFIRANDQAELTGSHDAHGDTEYQYTLQGDGPDATLMVKARKWASDTPDWEGVYVGQLAAFIDAHHDLIENYSPFRMVKGQYGRVDWHNRDTASERLDGQYGPLSSLRVWKANHVNQEPNSANAQISRQDARALLEAFPELWTDEARELVS